MSVSLAALGMLFGHAAVAQTAKVTGYVTQLEVHVPSAQVRFRVNSGADQVFCGSSVEADFPLTAGTTIAGYTYTQNVIETLKSHVYSGRLSPIEADVSTYIDGSSCAVTDIDLK